MNINWSNGIQSRNRAPWLLFIKGDSIIVFKGETVPNVAVVVGSDYTKDGKWSHRTYRIVLSSGVRHIAGTDGWETGRFVEGLAAAVGGKTPDTWLEIATALGVSVPSAMEFLRAWRPKAAQKLDEVEQALETLEEVSGEDSVFVTVSFGAPSNRKIREGYWESPKSIPGYDGAQIEKIDTQQGWVEGNIRVVGISGSIMSVMHTIGMHGGYYAVSVAVVPGTETPQEEILQSDDESPQEEIVKSDDESPLAAAFRKAGLGGQ